MLQKGIIETIEDKYTVKVRIPKYDKIESDATGTTTADLATGVICTLPGINLTYAIGDRVLVDFENDELSKPVILGLLYREQESDSILEIQGIDSSIDDINEKLNEISSQSLYTHIKYSNDNGMTFTSLYDPQQVTETLNFTLKSNNPIELDSNISYVYWNIINENNVDVTNSIPITTTLHGVNTLENIDESMIFNTPLIEIPLKLKPCTELEMIFEIGIPMEQADNYYVCLTTDNNTIGSVYGDYVGIQTSNDPEPSKNTKDYSWSSVTSRINANYSSNSSSSSTTVVTQNDLLKRVQANEKDIRGYSEDILDSSGNPIKSGIALLDAILITLNNIVIGLERNVIYLGNENNYVNVDNSELGINTLTQQEFTLTRMLINDSTQENESNIKPHLILYYVG